LLYVISKTLSQKEILEEKYRVGYPTKNYSR